MNVMIAGGTGLIGRKLALALTEAGHQVWVLSRNPRKVRLAKTIRIVEWDAKKHHWVGAVGGEDGCGGQPGGGKSRRETLEPRTPGKHPKQPYSGWRSSDDGNQAGPKTSRDLCTGLCGGVLWYCG